MDHSFVFREINRCLQPDGVSINLFPLLDVLWEGHAHMPLVHRVKDEDDRARAILFFSRLGFVSKYNKEKHNWNSLDDFSKKYSHTLGVATNYLSEKQIASVAKRSGFDIKFHYPKDFFLAKFYSYLGLRFYSYNNYGLLDKIGFVIGKRFRSATVLLSRNAQLVKQADMASLTTWDLKP